MSESKESASDTPSTTSNATSPADASTSAFPLADVKSSRIAAGGILQSKMWWITLLCLGVAVYLAWHAHRPTGIEITIDFPEGHGLKVGDALRHRGIDVGTVTDVRLARDLRGVRTHVMLDESAVGIANDQSHFWVVRPQLSLTNVSGLETAIGAKYIAVEPGSADRPSATEFEGLRDPPFVASDAGGFEITLRGVESHGINPGSPVSYLGVKVGQIVAVELGEKAQSAILRARLETTYQSLLRRGSRFWKTSGVEMDFGLKGFHLNTQSLATVAQGGVSFVTPRTRFPTDLQQVENGHEFVLHEEAEESWTRNAAEIKVSSHK